MLDSVIAPGALSELLGTYYIKFQLPLLKIFGQRLEDLTLDDGVVLAAQLRRICYLVLASLMLVKILSSHIERHLVRLCDGQGQHS